MVIQWTEDLAVGVNTIDEQHRGIFSRANILLTLMSEGKGRGEIGTVILFLADYVIKHFRAEEELMIRHNYHVYAAQKSDHIQFINDFSRLKKEFEAQGASSQLVIQTQKWLCNWLTNHIGTEDKKLGAFLKVVSYK